MRRGPASTLTSMDVIALVDHAAALLDAVQTALR
jgi:hypothetical protein